VRVTAAAGAVGLVVALAAGGWLRTLLFDVKPADTRTIAAALAVMTATALAASYIPVRRALASNPIASLRNE
jgi:ABC-type antimicrobial peptide transport system permease subunit